jgi:hypothetical protein
MPGRLHTPAPVRHADEGFKSQPLRKTDETRFAVALSHEEYLDLPSVASG